MPTKVDGWYEIPVWVCSGGAVPFPKDKFTLRDGSVAAGGEWLELSADGVTVRATPSQTGEVDRT